MGPDPLRGAGGSVGDLQLNCSLNRVAVKQGASAVVFVAIDVLPPLRAKVRKAPVMVALAIDCSISMTGEKLERAIDASRELAKVLGPKDALGVIAFSDKARVVMPMTAAPAPAFVDDHLKVLAADGQTNLFEALRACLTMLKEAAGGGGRVARALVLTDGQPTVGKKDDASFEKLAGKFREAGLAISAMGVGPDYNEALLTRLASTSGGSWHHIETSLRGLGPALGEEVEQMGGTIMQAPELRGTLLPGASVLQAFTIVPMLAAVDLGASDRGSVRVPIPDLAAGSNQTVVLRVRVPPLAAGRHTLAEFELGGVKSAVAFEATDDAERYGSEANPHARLLLTAAEGTIIARNALTNADRTEIGRSETIIKVVRSDPAMAAASSGHASVEPLVATMEKTQEAATRADLSAAERKRVAHDATVIKRAPSGGAP